MKNLSFLFLTLSFLCAMQACSDKTDDGTDAMDILVNEQMTDEGGGIEATDEEGNIISINFPPGALSDTVNVTLTILGEDTQYPIENGYIPSFTIRPEDINLYKPVEIKVKFKNQISNLEKNLLFKVRSENWLIPLCDQNFSNEENSISASTLFFGEFTEGEMSLSQLNTQFDLLLSSLDMTWKSYSLPSNPDCDTRIHKAIWDDWRETAGYFITFFKQRYLLGYYNDLEPGQNTYEEEQALICSNIIDKGAQLVLDQCIPDELCNDKDYIHTIGDMVRHMNLLGCEGSDVFNKVNERFNSILIDCGSFLTINTVLNIESDGFIVETSGVVPLTLSRNEFGAISVDGTGILTVTGEADAGGACTGEISGTTDATVTGVRDATYNFTLNIALEQYAFLTVTCPDGGPFVTPLVGGSDREVVLSKNNNFSVTIEEEFEGGLFTMDVDLDNPYTSLPDGVY
jgi:hypothetical protein